MSIRPFPEKWRLILLHCLVWMAVLIISFFSMLQEDGVRRSALFSCNSCTFYAIIVYGNIYFLYPRFYQKKHYLLYILGAILLLVIAGLGRGYLSKSINNPAFAAAPHWVSVRASITFLLS